MAVNLTYKEGYPTKKCIKALLAEFGITHGINSMDAYGFNHSIAWSNQVINEEMLNFVDYISALGVKVSQFREYDSPMTGSITFAKQ